VISKFQCTGERGGERSLGSEDFGEEPPFRDLNPLVRRAPRDRNAPSNLKPPHLAIDESAPDLWARHKENRSRALPSHIDLQIESEEKTFSYSLDTLDFDGSGGDMRDLERAKLYSAVGFYQVSLGRRLIETAFQEWIAILLGSCRAD
jgi:hypothetical protein